MIAGLTSIVIATYNHGHCLADAIVSALAQTANVEVLIVDDGSDDGTMSIGLAYSAGAVTMDPRVRYFPRQHEGVSSARNYGIEQARGEFIMFLDADDVIAPDKVAVQLEAMADGIGWVVGDTAIIDVGGARTYASERYNYDAKHWGWIQPDLVAGNFIPIMAALIRRRVLGGIRFHVERAPEDWFFWHALAGVSRCAYVAHVGSCYRKREGGRNTRSQLKPWERPGVELPLRLNLGCGTPNTRSWHPMPGLVNLDASLGWRFEDGLSEFADASVAGITISHALMYLDIDNWPRVFDEFARVLRPGGVLRITEDDTTTTGSARIGGWRGSAPAATCTDAAMVRRAMDAAGFTVRDVTADTTSFHDTSLMQSQHGAPPDVFFAEGVRECCVLFTPHSDDETLFAAFTIIRRRPRVYICFPSSGDYGDTDVRTEESRRAVAILGGGPVEQWNGGDIAAQMRAVDKRLRPTVVFAPSSVASHLDHLAVAFAAADVFGDRLRSFHTYDVHKVRAGNPVAFEAGWLELKRAAMAEYKTQLAHPRAHQFFDWDLAEYSE